MATEASLKRLRDKYSSARPLERPFFIGERSWAMFTAYVYEDRTIQELADSSGLSLSRVRQMLRGVDAQFAVPRKTGLEWTSLTLQSPVEDLDVSVRARNALHHIGCNSVQDVLRLDMSGPLRRLGNATRAEVLAALQNAGFRHPSLASPAPEIATVTRSLERMHARIDGALKTVAKEVSLLQDRLRKWQEG